MFGFISKTETVVAVDLSDDTTTKAVVVSSSGDKLLVQNWEFYSEEDSGGSDLISGYKPAAIAAVLGDGHALCFPTPEIDQHNLDLEKRKYGVTGDNQITDYLNISRSALLVSAYRETTQEVVEGVKSTFPDIPNIVISQSMVSLLYLYLRCYIPEVETKTAILHFAGQIVSLLVVQTEMPIWEGSVDINRQDKEAMYSEIYALLQAPADKLDSRPYDLLLLAGDCSEKDIDAMRGIASRIELFSPFKNKVFEFGQGVGKRQRELTKQGHRLAVAIASTGLLFEGVGVNLANTEIDLQKELSLHKISQKEQLPSSAFLAILSNGLQVALPVIFGQTKLLLAGLIAGFLFVGYQFYNIASEIEAIDKAIGKERERATELADVSSKYNEYKKKIAEFKTEVATIEELRKSQLTVKQVLDELDARIPKGLVFTEVEVQGTDLKLKGYAPDRLAVISLANRLGQSIGTFADVVPVYDDKTNIGNYEITCKYIGTIPVNSLPVPFKSSLSTKSLVESYTKKK